MSHFHVSVTYLEEPEYDSMIAERRVELTDRQQRDGDYGTALLSIHPDERALLESGEPIEQTTAASP